MQKRAYTCLNVLLQRNKILFKTPIPEGDIMNKLFLVAILLVLIIPISIFNAKTNSQKSSLAKEAEPMEPKRNSSVTQLTPANIKTIVQNIPNILIVDFYAEWCGPCKVMKPIFEEIADELKGKYTFATVNIDECKEFAQECKIMSIPTIGIFSAGTLIEKIIGQQTKETLMERITQALSMPKDLRSLDQKTLNDKLIQSVQSMAELDALQRLIDAGADINAVSAQGFTPLGLAIIMLGASGIEVTELVKFLLKNGASTKCVFPGNPQEVDLAEYPAAMVMRFKMLSENFEKIDAVFKEHREKGQKSSCENGSCSL